MDFQVNGETYFLSLAENERQWLLFVESATGARSVPVYEDAPEFKGFEVVLEEDDEDKNRRKIPN